MHVPQARHLQLPGARVLAGKSDAVQVVAAAHKLPTATMFIADSPTPHEQFLAQLPMVNAFSCAQLVSYGHSLGITLPQLLSQCSDSSFVLQHACAGISAHHAQALAAQLQLRVPWQLTDEEQACHMRSRNKLESEQQAWQAERQSVDACADRPDMPIAAQGVQIWQQQQQQQQQHHHHHQPPHHVGSASPHGNGRAAAAAAAQYKVAASPELCHALGDAPYAPMQSTRFDAPLAQPADDAFAEHFKSLGQSDLAMPSMPCMPSPILAAGPLLAVSPAQSSDLREAGAWRSADHESAGCTRNSSLSGSSDGLQELMAACGHAVKAPGACAPDAQLFQARRPRCTNAQTAQKPAWDSSRQVRCSTQLHIQHHLRM
jgi:hypothetical protein